MEGPVDYMMEGWTDGWMECFTLELGSSNGGKIRRMNDVLCYALVGRLVYWGVESFFD